MPSLTVRRLGALLALSLVAACDDVTGPLSVGPPAALQIVAGDAQADTVGHELREALVVRVVDSAGRAIPLQVINFRVTAGGGSVFAGVALTDSAGEARERWTLGTVAQDTQKVEARAVDTRTGLALVFGTFKAVGVPDRAASLTVAPATQADSARFIGGDTLLTGDSVAFVASARDRYGNVKPSPQVTWASGDTAVASVSATGVVAVKKAGAGTLRATVDTVTASRSFVAAQRLPFDLQLVSGSNQTDSVDATLAAPLVVRAVDRRGRGFQGAEVTFRGENATPVDTTAGCSCKRVTTDGNGLASAQWVLGITTGSATLRAAGRVAPGGVVFDSLAATATVLHGAAQNIAKVSGGGSSTGLIVAVRDRHGNPVFAVVVHWRVTSGTGTLSDTLSVTDASGLAGTAVTSATGTITVEASVVGVAGSPVSFIVTATPSYALDFNQSWVTVPDHADLDLGTTWTIEAWIKPRSGGGGDEHVISKWGGCVDASYSVVISGGKLLSGIASCANGTQVVQSSGTVVDGQWQHIAVTLSNDSLRLYINGVLDTVRTGSQAPLNTATELTLGRHSGGGYPFDGLLDEVRVWTVARTGAQIAGAMNHWLQGNEAGLVAYWRFDEGSGDSAFDATGRGHTGRLGNAAGADANDPRWTADGAPIP
jgi:hypothetical protein